MPLDTDKSHLCQLVMPHVLALDSTWLPCHLITTSWILLWICSTRIILSMDTSKRENPMKAENCEAYQMVWLAACAHSPEGPFIQNKCKGLIEKPGNCSLTSVVTKLLHCEGEDTHAFQKTAQSAWVYVWEIVSHKFDGVLRRNQERL